MNTDKNNWLVLWLLHLFILQLSVICLWSVDTRLWNKAIFMNSTNVKNYSIFYLKWCIFPNACRNLLFLKKSPRQAYTDFYFFFQHLKSLEAHRQGFIYHLTWFTTSPLGHTSFKSCKARVIGYSMSHLWYHPFGCLTATALWWGGKKSWEVEKVSVVEQWVESTLQRLSSPHDTL